MKERMAREVTGKAAAGGKQGGGGGRGDGKGGGGVGGGVGARERAVGEAAMKELARADRVLVHSTTQVALKTQVSIYGVLPGMLKTTR